MSYGKIDQLTQKNPIQNGDQSAAGDAPPPYDGNENSVSMFSNKVNESPSTYQRKPIKNNAMISGDFGKVNSSVACATKVTAETQDKAFAQISKVLEYGVENNPTFSGTAKELNFNVGCIDYENTSSIRMFGNGASDNNSNKGICSRFCTLL